MKASPGMMIRIHRILLGMTQDDLAEKTGISAVWISRIERDEVVAGTFTRWEIAKALGLDQGILERPCDMEITLTPVGAQGE